MVLRLGKGQPDFDLDYELYLRLLRFLKVLCIAARNICPVMFVTSIGYKASFRLRQQGGPGKKLRKVENPVHEGNRAGSF